MLFVSNYLIKFATADRMQSPLVDSEVGCIT